MDAQDVHVAVGRQGSGEVVEVLGGREGGREGGRIRMGRNRDEDRKTKEGRKGGREGGREGKTYLVHAGQNLAEGAVVLVVDVELLARLLDDGDELLELEEEGGGREGGREGRREGCEEMSRKKTYTTGSRNIFTITPLPPSLTPSLLPFLSSYLVRGDGREQVVLNLDIDPRGDDGPEPGVDAEVGGRLDLTHTPRGRLGGRLHTPGREVVRLQEKEGGREGRGV